MICTAVDGLAGGCVFREDRQRGTAVDGRSLLAEAEAALRSSSVRRSPATSPTQLPGMDARLAHAGGGPPSSQHHSAAWQDAMLSISGRRPAKKKQQDAVFFVKTDAVFFVETDGTAPPWTAEVSSRRPRRASARRASADPRLPHAQLHGSEP